MRRGEFADGGDDVVGSDDVPAHLLGKVEAATDHGGLVFGGSREALHDLRGEFAGDGVVKSFSVGAGDGFVAVDGVGRGLVIDVIRNDDVGRAVGAGDFFDEAGAATDGTHDAKRPEGEGLQLGDAEGFVDGHAELKVAALADVPELHVGGHSVTAGFAVEAELIDKENLRVTGAGVVGLDAGVKNCLAVGEVGHSFAVSDGPIPFLFHALNVGASARAADFGGEDDENRGLA